MTPPFQNWKPAPVIIARSMSIGAWTTPSEIIDPTSSAMTERIRSRAAAVRERSGSTHIVVERADASAAALSDAATLAERVRTALGAESFGEQLPEVPVLIVPDPEEDPR